MQTSLFGLGKVLTPEPNKVWVPKATPILFDVGVGSHMTLEAWYLGGGCMSMMDTIIDASLSRKFGGRTTIFWRLREQCKLV